MNIAKSIKAALELRGMKQMELADKLGIHKAGISQIIGRDCVNTDTLKKIADAFGMKASELIQLGESEED